MKNALSKFTKFFHDCECKLMEHNIQTGGRSILINKYNPTKSEWSSTFNVIPDWYKILWNEEIQAFKSIPSIDECVTVLLEKFSSPNYSKILPDDDPEQIKRLIAYQKHSLVFLFIQYKELNAKFGISLSEFLETQIEDLFSTELQYYFRANFLGIRSSKDLPVFQIGRFTIRCLNSDEKLDMMNNLKSGMNKFDSSIIAVSYEDCMLYDMWISSEGSHHVDVKRCSDFTNPRLEIEFFSSELEILFLAFRLCGFQVGIRDWFLKEGLALKSSNYFYPWTVNRYKLGDFHTMSTTSRSSMTWDINLGKHKFQIEDIEIVQNVFEKLTDYYKNPIEEISLGLMYYSRAFEQTRAEFAFSDLIMSFESILSAPHRVDKQLLYSLIIESDTRSKAKKTLNKIWGQGIQKAISYAAVILKNDHEERSIKDFFSSGAENGVFKIRNMMFHGNLSDNINPIIKLLPQFSTYLQEIISYLLGQQLSKSVFSGDDYYEELDNHINGSGS